MKRLFYLFAIICIAITLQSCLEIKQTDNIEQTKQAESALSTETEMPVSMINQFVAIDENAYGREQFMTEVSQSNFNKVQPPKRLNWSLERWNLNTRNLLFNDPNKISYIYLLSDMGTILTYHAIRGKVSSVNSKLTTNQQLISKYDYGSDCVGVVESPAMDGSYGSNGDAIFGFFL